MSQSKKQRTIRKRKIRGGSCGGGAANHMLCAAGGMGQQVAVPGTNVLHYRPVTGSGIVGGSKKFRKGGNLVTDLAVPALFIGSTYALSKAKRGGNSRRVSRYTRKSR